MRFTICCCVLMVASCGEDEPGGNRRPPLPIQYTIGGTVTGLEGDGLVLENNDGDDLAISSDGAFTFATSVTAGTAYAVTVQSQPSSPGQVCTVANGTGTADSNVTSVAVACVTNTHTIGGTVTGLTTTGLVLQNNGGDDLPITADGAFTFATAIADASEYRVAVLSHPSGPPPQFCTVTGGTGTVSGADVTTVAVACTDDDIYSVGGTVTGLAGTGLVLQNNGADDLPIAANGAFTFVTPVAAGAQYLVTVLTQPTSPAQTCSVAAGFGSMHDDHITDVVVTCSTDTYTVGGTVIGLLGTDFVLQNNGGDNLAIDTDGAYTFPIPVADGSGYHVTVFEYPNDPIQNCSISNAIGTVNGANVTNVDITCPAPPVTPSVAATIKTLQFSWNDVGADHYELWVKPDAASPFEQIAADLSVTSVDVPISVHLLDWDDAIYHVYACNPVDQCSHATANIEPAMVDTIGYFKASDTHADAELGHAVALSDDGTTLAVGAPELEDIAGGGNVYVFRSTAGTWAEEAVLSASNAGVGDRFGWSVALDADGDTLAVGAPSEDGSSGDADDNRGAVYVFTHTGSDWDEEAYVSVVTYAEAGSRLGMAVSLSDDGDTLAAGAPFDDRDAMGFDNGETDDAGAVHILERTDTTWSVTGYLKALNADAGDWFGFRVSMSGDGQTLAISAFDEDGDGVNGEANNDLENAGAVYVFSRGTTTWVQDAYLKAGSPDTWDRFGYSISLNADGTSLAIGADYEDGGIGGINGDETDDSASVAGAAYLFTLDGTPAAWAQDAYLKAGDPDSGDGFGSSVSLSADGLTLAVGAPYEDSGAVGVGGDETSSGVAGGAVYVFAFDPSAGWDQISYVKATNPGANDEFGRSIALDATAETLAVGAKDEDSNATGIGGDDSNDDAEDAGAVYLY